MNIVYYEDQNYYYFWKPQGLASNFGKEDSFLDLFVDVLEGRLEVSGKVLSVVSFLNLLWGQEKEFGMLNRLDVQTGGLLYFAKSCRAMNEYKELQQDGKLEKTYIADVKGDFYHDEIVIDTPIMHHRHVDEKMIVIASENSMRKARGKKHLVKTYVRKLYYDKDEDVSTLEIKISKGIRHQIRVHLASVGNPIIGDELYGDGNGDLCLWSVGLR